MAIRVSTHSPERLGFYRWTAEETWEYRSDCYAFYYFMPAGTRYKDGVVSKDTVAAFENGENIYYCWTSDSRSQLMTGSTEALTMLPTSTSCLIISILLILTGLGEATTLRHPFPLGSSR